MTQPTCELCSSNSDTTIYSVSLPSQLRHPNTAHLCVTCQSQIEQPGTPDARRWRCLQESIWTENPAVKVLAWRILSRLSAETWAQDLLAQLYLEEDLLAWAQAEAPAPSEATQTATRTRDSNGTVLLAGDSVTLIKDLDVKGANFTAKRGTLVKHITLTEDPGLIEGRVNGTRIVLKTEFLKKASTGA